MQTLAHILRERREEIVRAWVGGVSRDIVRYRTMEPERLADSVRTHFEGILAYLERGDRDPIRCFAERTAREWVSEQVPIEGTLRSFRQGASVVAAAVAALPEEDRQAALALIDEAFHSSVVEYGEAYAEARFRTTPPDQDAWMVQWRTLLEGSADAILFLDHAGTIRSWNQGAVDLLGYRQEEIVGKPFTVLLPDELRETGELERLERATAAGAIRGYETGRVDRHGARIPVELSRHVVFDRRGRRIGVTEIMRDLRERQEREASRLQAERLAVIGAMSARLAHEIRNPLSAAVLNLEMLREEVDEGRSQNSSELLEALEREVRRVERVLDDYLRFARMPAPRKSRVELRSLVEDLVLFLGADANVRQVALVEERGSRAAEVEGDPEQLRQMLLNLVRNAVEAVPPGGRVGLRVLEGGRKQADPADPLAPDLAVAIVEIEDNGPGIPTDVRERMFQPFYSTKPLGTGLGLPLAQQVAAEHGGTITCESRVGEGTRFRVTLPAAP